MTRCVKQWIVITLLSASTATLSISSSGQAVQGLPPARVPSSAESATGRSGRQGQLEQQLRSLARQVALQQKEIDELRLALEKQQALSSSMGEDSQGHPPAITADSTGAHPARAETLAARSSPPAFTTARTDVAGLKVAAAAVLPAPAQAVQAADASTPSAFEAGREQNPALPNSPIASIPLRVGDATVTPVGFVDATEFFRTTNLGSGIGTAFGSLPFSNTLRGRMTENRFTIQNSRIGLQFDTQFRDNHVRGYLESDFLGLQPGNAFVTSNSDSLRMRLYWVDLSHGKFEFLAGQSWSLLTPGRDGISPMPSNLFYTQNMDTNYQAGLTWARQLQFRFVYHASPRVAAAVSLENAEQYTGGAVTLPPGFSASQVSTGEATSTPNRFPDVIGKLAFDPEVGGRHLHFEVAGLLSSFRTFSLPLNRTLTAEGGGGSFNADIGLFKNFHVVESSFFSRGGGRYIFGLGPDFVVRPDGSPSLVTADSGVGGIEYQLTPRMMFYAYYGGAYFGRNFSVIPATSAGGAQTYVGFGYPAASSSSSEQNRAIQEATFGTIRNFWKSPRYGALQLITQYSYLTRAPWFVAPGSPKNAHLSQAYADIRYILP